MKSIKKLLTSLLTKCFLIILVVVLMCLSVLVVNADEYTINDIAKQQEVSIDQNNNILNYFRDTIKLSRTNYDPLNMELSYPDYYGGSYLDENGKLNILLTNNNEYTKKQLRDVAQNDELTFVTASYSYAELTEMINTIISYQDDYYNRILNDNSYDIARDIVECTLDDMNNRIIVGIKELTETKIKEFNNKVLNSNAIQFENSICTPMLNSEISKEAKEVSYQKLDSSIFTESVERSFTVKPGMQIFCNNGYNYSAGFPVYRTITSGKQYGFLTAGHLMEVGDIIYNPNDFDQDAIGTVRLNRVGGKYDVSFVSLNSGTVCSNNIANTTHYLCPSNYELDYPVSGKTVSLYGFRSYTSGKIRSTNYSFHNGDNTSFTGMVATDYDSMPGDSGGLVASICTGSESGVNYTKMQEGIHCGYRKLDNNSIVGAYYCSAVNIVNLWYLVCY